MLTISPINHNYYNKDVSFRANSQEAGSEPETPKEYSYADLSVLMRKLAISGIEEQEVIPPAKGTTDIQKTMQAESDELETLPANQDGWTKLHEYCYSGRPKEFLEFIKKHPNFDPNQRTKEGQSYIYFAVSYTDKTIILPALAANKNLDLNITNANGWNDMHSMCCWGTLEAVKIFIKNHPDFNPNQLTKDGSSYIKLAEQLGHKDIADYLTKYTKKKMRHDKWLHKIKIL